MNRLFSLRVFVSSFLFLTGWLTFSCNRSLSQPQKLRPEQPYNILMIAVDDLNDWTGFLGGHPDTQTPHMDRLAKSGIVFERAYCAASVCNPSRAALMSGLHPSTSGIYHNKDDMFAAPSIQEVRLLPEYLSKHGYFTMSRGKIYHRPNIGQHTWNLWSPVSGSYGGVKKEEGKMANGIPRGEMAENMDWGPTDARFEDTPDFGNAQWAAQQLDKDYDRPFFLACGIFRPHLKWHVPETFFQKFDLEKLELPQINENDLEDVTGGHQPTREYKTIKKYGRQKEAIQAYLASINYADACIGLLLDALNNSKYRDNTVVILWGDHGWHLGEKLRYKKFTLWEESSRVPMIIKAPGLTAPNSRCHRPVNLLDLYPTIVELCQLPSNNDNQGRSLLPLLRRPNRKWDHPSLTQMGEGRNTLRTERWRYIRYEDGREELYDHQRDSLEWTNLANDPEFDSLRRKFSNQLDEMMR